MPSLQRAEMQRNMEVLIAKGLVQERKNLSMVLALLTPKKDGTWRTLVYQQSCN